MEFLIGLLGGFVAWLATTVIATPLHRFMNLRASVAREIALYENRVREGDPEAEQPPADWMARRKQAYEMCGAELMGFSFSNSLMTRVLHRVPGSPFYPWRASSYLMTLAETTPGSGASAQAREGIQKALRLKYRP
jgi:hypothetical protein